MEVNNNIEEFENIVNESEDIISDNEITLDEVLNEKDQEIETWKNKYMYTLSDFENYKRNAIKEKSNLYKYGSKKVIKDILPIIDDFERSFEHMDEATKEGVSLIYNKFISILKNHDVKIIEPNKGDKFTEDLHEAITAIPSDNETNIGTIADVIEKGYMLYDKVIRYAKVVVYN